AESAVKADDASGAIAAYSSTLSAPFAHYAGRVSVFAGTETGGLDLRADGGDSDIRFYTGGVGLDNKKMFITKDGNVGIGTNSTSLTNYKLYVESSDSLQQFAIRGVCGSDIPDDRYGVSGTVYGSSEENSYGVHGLASSTTGDNYGIYGKAHFPSSGDNYGVYGYAFNGGTGDTYAIYGKAFESGSGDTYAGYFDGDIYIEDNVYANSNIFVSNKLGIGTENPTNLLELSSSGPKMYFNREASVTDYSGFYWRSTADDFEGCFVRNHASGDFELYSDISGGTPRMVIKEAGNVGIGTTNPKGKLDVNGSIYQRGGELHADYVFEPDYELESIEEHAEFMWQKKHLPAIPKASVDQDGLEIVEVGS
ncbi:MAG: hypothetical protein GY869_31250, partial [Planctomycetes bacterium]|nr:hypothetical protein [Planctomycetota bacterium]